ncbi:MAG: hypothetical protein MSC51_04215 [Mollicutes bacterium]|nr:hypothetical protein [Mollicutes bacterium]
MPSFSKVSKQDGNSNTIYYYNVIDPVNENENGDKSVNKIKEQIVKNAFS